MGFPLGNGCYWHTRDEWAQGRQVVGNPGSRALTELDEFYAHHSGGTTLGDPDPAQWVRNIYDEHVHGRGYSDIAYEILADERGDLWEGRPMHLQSAATLNHNRTSVACCELRAHDPEGDNNVPLAVKIAFMWAYQLSSLGAGRSLVARCHRDVYATDCPGQDMADWVHGGGLSVALPTGSTGGGPTVGLPAWPAWPKIVLKRGLRGTAVAAWAHRMNLVMPDAHMVEGDAFGKTLEDVTKVFQALRHLPATGAVDKRTWDAAR